MDFQGNDATKDKGKGSYIFMGDNRHETLQPPNLNLALLSSLDYSKGIRSLSVTYLPSNCHSSAPLTPSPIGFYHFRRFAVHY